MPNDAECIYTGTELDAMSAAVNYHRWIVDRFAPFLGRRVAEVGAGIGSVSKLLLSHGVDHLLAFEPSKNMFPGLAEELRDEPRARPINDYFRADYAAEAFDSIVYINVLEHIEDDHAEMAKAYSALRPAGHLLVFVPALAWLYSDFDKELGHFRRYSKSGLRRAVQKAGFDVLHCQYFDMAGILPWFVSLKLLKGRPNRGSVGVYDRFIVPIMRWVERPLPPPIGKNLLLVARRPS